MKVFLLRTSLVLLLVVSVWGFCAYRRISFLASGSPHTSLTIEESVQQGVFIDSFICVTGNAAKYGFRMAWMEHDYIIPGIYMDESKITDSLYKFYIPLVEYPDSGSAYFSYTTPDTSFKYMHLFSNGDNNHHLETFVDEVDGIDSIKLGVHNTRSGNDYLLDSVVFVRWSIVNGKRQTPR